MASNRSNATARRPRSRRRWWRRATICHSHSPAHRHHRRRQHHSGQQSSYPSTHVALLRSCPLTRTVERLDTSCQERWNDTRLPRLQGCRGRLQNGRGGAAPMAALRPGVGCKTVAGGGRGVGMRSQRGRGVTGVCSIVSSVLRTSHAVGVSVLGMPENCCGWRCGRPVVFASGSLGHASSRGHCA